MKEQDYQTKIIKGIEAIGGEAINGNFTKAGTADLICGWPYIVDSSEKFKGYTISEPRLLHLHVEVKTPEDYERVFRSIEEVDGRYVFKEDTSSLKKHETLQITKLNRVRDKGGLGLIAHSFEQVKEYVECNTY